MAEKSETPTAAETVETGKNEPGEAPKTPASKKPAVATAPKKEAAAPEKPPVASGKTDSFGAFTKGMLGALGWREDV